MKNFILFLSLLLISNFIKAQSNKQLIRSIKCEVSLIQIDMGYHREISYWESGYIKMEIYITSQLPQTKLDYEVSSGKYDIIELLKDKLKIVKFKNIKNEVDDNIKIKLFVPKNIQILNSEYI